ncbi:cytochrome c oxidase assembly protein COX20, mitochondrial [Panulirus ornatus]|uniref:cytochrome c oxidase assembly protein COX20, mitochondrial n=1 Tax=Panulirus ornatus TaxID=150431 RepID=UPI003A8431F2
MEEEPKTKLLGRDLSQMPCFRQTFLYSISSGLTAGLLFFLLTSNVRRSAHICLGTYGCVTLGYWSYCRYNFSKKKFNMSHLNMGMQKQALHGDTEMEEQDKGKA